MPMLYLPSLTASRRYAAVPGFLSLMTSIDAEGNWVLNTCAKLINAVRTSERGHAALDLARQSGRSSVRFNVLGCWRTYAENPKMYSRKNGALAAASLVAGMLALALSGPAQAQNERTKGTIVGGAVGGLLGGGKGMAAGAIAGNLVGAVVKKERRKDGQAGAAPQTEAKSAGQQKAEPAQAETVAVVEPSSTREDILAEVMPVIYHTCASLVEAHGGDEAAILEDISKMAALSLDNRKIDLSAMEISEADAEQIRTDFANAIGERCAQDSDALVAGIVDTVVAEIAATRF